MSLSKHKSVRLPFLGAALIGAGLALAVRPTAAAPSQEPQRPAEKTTQGADAKDAVQVRGVVLDPQGKPLAGAKLYLGGHPALVAPTYPVRATSGKDGRFDFTFSVSELKKTDPEDRAVQVLAVAEGHGCAWVTADASAGEKLTLRLVKDGPVGGRILDAEGKPVAAAKLTVTGVAAKGDELFVDLVRIGNFGYAFDRGWVGPLPGQPAALTTDADGRFKLPNVGPDRIVSLLLEGRGIATALLGASGTSFEHQASISRSIRGVVRDRDTGKPVAGVTVSWSGTTHNRRYGLSSARYYHAITDKDGRYELLGVPKSSGAYKGIDYLLSVRPADGQLYLQQTVTLTDTPGLEPLTRNVELFRGVSVSGKVTDRATGKPVAGALVEYYPLYPNPGANKTPLYSYLRSEAVTGADGSYRLSALPGQGVIAVTGEKDTYRVARLSGSEIKGFFKAPLAPKAEDTLWAYGGNSFAQLPPVVDYPCQGLALLEPGEADKALVKDVSLEPSRERKGRVVGPDGEPLSGVTVQGLSSVLNAKKLEGAEFTVRGWDPASSRQLLFRHKEKNLGFYLKALPEEKADPFVVKLQSCGSISGRLVDRDGQPFAGGHIRVGAITLRVGGGEVEVTADKDGRFRVEGIVPGMPYVLTRRNATGANYYMVKGPLKDKVVVEPGKNTDVGNLRVDD